MGTKDDQLAADFAALLRELRTAAGLTQGQLGERIDPPMQLQAIARYESGTRAPTLPLLYRLAKALGCKPCDLLPKGTEVPSAEEKAASEHPKRPGDRKKK